MPALTADLRLAVRTLVRKPGVTALAVASLGLAIGFSTAAFSVLDAFALRELPVAKPAELARLWVMTREQRPDGFNWFEFEAIASRTRLLAGIVAENRQLPIVKLHGRDDFPITAGVSDNYFDVLGVRAAIGDAFHAGQGQDQTVAISDHYWKNALESDPAIIGRYLTVGKTVLRVIAVMPPGFSGTNRGLLVDLFVPSQTFFGALHGGDRGAVRESSHEVVARLRPGVSLAQARAECDSILRQVSGDGHAPGLQRTSGIVNFTDKGVWQKLESNAVLLGVVALLILIAAANLANLRLVENEGRRHETAIRLALGAGPGALARQHLSETLLLSGMATGLGLLIAGWLIRMAPALLNRGVRYVDYGVTMDARSFAFSSGILVLVAVAGTLIPWSDAWRRRIGPAMQGTRTTRPSRWLWVLVVTQMAVVTGVTCSAGLLWRSIEKLSEIRPAMDPDRRMLLVQGTYSTAAAANTRAAELAGKIAATPGVQHVAWARRAMLSGSGGGAVVDLEMPGQGKMSFPLNQVSPGYFAATGARVLHGRAFQESDGPASTPVVMVSSAVVRRFFSGQPPLGTWIRVAGKDRQVVGVVEDGPQNHLLELVQPYFYFPFAQMPTRQLTWLIDAQVEPGSLAEPVRSLLRGADSEFTITDMHTLREQMRNARSDQQLAAEVTGALAMVGLLLAAAGLFGVTLFAVERRTPEFGVRVAIGASPAQLLRQVLGEAGRRVAAAIPIGWALAYAGRHAIEKQLYGVEADDPRTFAAATVLVVVIGCIAALRPAIRAARIDPMAALRNE